MLGRQNFRDTCATLDIFILSYLKRNGALKKANSHSSPISTLERSLGLQDLKALRISRQSAKSAYELNEIITENSLTVSAQKTKLMTFKG
jgi:hypothetical protein